MLRTRRSYDAAMKRYLRSEAYRTVALAGGGTREVARRLKQAHARNVIADAKAEQLIAEAALRRLDRVAAFHKVAAPCCDEKVGKTHIAALAAAA